MIFLDAPEHLSESCGGSIIVQLKVSFRLNDARFMWVKMMKNEEANPYLRRQWKAVRLIKLRRNPICESCFEVGKVNPTEVVHHLNHNPWDNNPKNLKSLCRECHEKIHGRKSKTDCDVEGMPLDPTHPWNKAG